MFVRANMLCPKRTVCKTRALDLTNQAITTYICKPTMIVHEKLQVTKLEPGICKLVYIQCDSNELCKIAELELPKAPEITFVLPEKYDNKYNE